MNLKIKEKLVKTQITLTSKRGLMSWNPWCTSRQILKVFPMSDGMILWIPCKMIVTIWKSYKPPATHL